MAHPDQILDASLIVQNKSAGFFQNGCEHVHARSVLQSVKAICAVLCKIETIDIIKAGQKLQMLTIEKVRNITKSHGHCINLQYLIWKFWYRNFVRVAVTCDLCMITT